MGTAVGAFLGAGIGVTLLTMVISILLGVFFNDLKVYNGKLISEIMRESVWITVNSIADV